VIFSFTKFWYIVQIINQLKWISID